MLSSFKNCEICGAHDWHPVYRGAVRDGVFGRTRPDTAVARCQSCGADRLDESVCPDDAFYETEAYRKKLQEALTAEGYYAVSDELQTFTQQALWPRSLRDKTIADIGCAGGNFLDCVAGMARQCVAIEPCSIYHPVLQSRGYKVFPYAQDARESFAGKLDIAVSVQVIEHIRNPQAFLKEIHSLMAPEGVLVISTPNRNDILMELLPDDFPSFFYRVVHRWYFDADSLAECARRAGFEVVETQFVHRYGMSNAMAWLRDRRPTGRSRLPGIEPVADKLWAGYLEQSGRAECIYMVLKRAD